MRPFPNTRFIIFFKEYRNMGCHKQSVGGVNFLFEGQGQYRRFGRDALLTRFTIKKIFERWFTINFYETNRMKLHIEGDRFIHGLFHSIR